MEVRDSLASILAVVDDQTITAVGDTFFDGYIGSGDEQVAKSRAIFNCRLTDPRNRFGGHNQNMDWGLRGDVTKGDAEIVTMDDIRRDLLVSNLLEKRHFCHFSTNIQVDCKFKSLGNKKKAATEMVTAEKLFGDRCED